MSRRLGRLGRLGRADRLHRPGGRRHKLRNNDKSIMKDFNRRYRTEDYILSSLVKLYGNCTDASTVDTHGCA